MESGQRDPGEVFQLGNEDNTGHDTDLGELLLAHLVRAVSRRDVTAEDVIWSPMPFFWIGGFVFSFLGGMHRGATMVVEETFEPDGFYRTGDLCVIDETGCLTFRSRLGDMLKVHGANVAPLEVERCLNAQQGVFDSAVLGLPDGRGDTLVAAAVVPLEGAELDEQELIARLRQELSSYKVPKRIAFLAAEAIPRTGSGKVQKFKLKPILEEALKA